MARLEPDASTPKPDASTPEPDASANAGRAGAAAARGGKALIAARMATRAVNAGGVAIGGGSPISVQSMTTTKTADAKSTARQINELAEAGCDIVRVAVPDMESARAIAEIKRLVGIPIVADVHFDYRLAIEAIEHGADKARVNPGNIGGRDEAMAVAMAAKARGVPIRIGVNGGSLERALLEEYGSATPEAMARSALAQADVFESCGFRDIVVSIKSTDVFAAVEACRIVARSGRGYPQHIGMTEAGASVIGASRNAIGISALLREGIGDTLRVSLTGDPVDEAVAGVDILRTHGFLRGGVRIVSCPTCGRCELDLAGVAREVERRARSIRCNRVITAAVMGCAVNGPGEARAADAGIAGGKGSALLFRRGEPVRIVAESEAADALIAEIASIAAGEAA